MVSTLTGVKEKLFPTLQDNLKNIAWLAEKAILAHPHATNMFQRLFP